MDIEVVGRHALLFDDDANAAFVNSGNALVEWHSLQIDRYDVRHLLSAPPPPRRRNRNLESKSSDELLIDQERYLDLPSDSDQPDLEDDEKPSSGEGFHSVPFSYGNTDDSADPKNTDGGMESSGYLPPFTIPGNIVQSLPPTEKVHQIIARTALFVSQHGGQSEIVLRVKQGDNPTFGFLMPDHHLHAYFRYLVEHPELLRTDFDEKSQDEKKKAGIEHDNSNSAGGALSLLGSVYGSLEDEEGDDAVNLSPTHDTEKVESIENAAKDGPVSRKPILSNKENVPAVKKNSSIIASKPKSVKGIKKDGTSGLLSAAEEKLKNNQIGATLQPSIPEPLPEMKRLIDKLVEFVIRNGKQFEATLLEQDSKHVRFPFLLPSNQYHPYYVKALQAAQESKVNGKSFNSGKDIVGGRGINRKASTCDLSYSSDFGDVPFESDRKEKFKMVIGKSKKEGQETEKGNEDGGVTVDAAAAAAILEAATRGIKNSDSHNHLNRSDGGQPVGGADSSDTNLTEDQKRKAERLKKAKMFVAMLKSGAVPTKSGTSRDPSVEPLEPGVLRSASEVDHTNIEREGSLPPVVVSKLPTAGNLSEQQSERISKRNYRSKLGGCEDDGSHRQRVEHNEEEHSKRKYRSRSRRDKNDEDEIAAKKERKHCREKGRRGSLSSEENKSEESSEQDKDHKRSKSVHVSHHSQQDKKRDEEYNEHHLKRKHRSRSRRHKEDEDTVEKEHRHRKRRNRAHSSEESENEEESGGSDRERKHHRKMHHEKRSRSRRHGDENGIENSYEEQNSEEDDVSEAAYEKEEGRKRSSKRRLSHERRNKHRSHHSKDKHQHRDAHSSRDKSWAQHEHDSSSDGEVRVRAARPEKEFRDDLEEGEISSKVLEESRGINSGGEGGTSVDVMSSQQRAPSQPSDTADIPADLRAKIRAMLMATRS